MTVTRDMGAAAVRKAAQDLITACVGCEGITAVALHEIYDTIPQMPLPAGIKRPLLALGKVAGTR